MGPDVAFSEFKDIYLKAYEGGASGITTFRPGGKREGIMQKPPTEPPALGQLFDVPSGKVFADTEKPPTESTEGGAACTIDAQGNRTCD